MAGRDRSGHSKQRSNSYVWLIKEFEGRSRRASWAAKTSWPALAPISTRRKRLKGRLKAFSNLRPSEAQTEHFKLSIQANGGVLPLIVPSEWEHEPASSPERSTNQGRTEPRSYPRGDQERRGDARRLPRRALTHLRIR